MAPPTRPVSCRPRSEWTPDLGHPPQAPPHLASSPGRLLPPIPKSRGDSAHLPGAPSACAEPAWPGFTRGARKMLETSLPHPQASTCAGEASGPGPGFPPLIGSRQAAGSGVYAYPCSRQRVRAKALGLDSSSFPCSGLKSPWSFSDPASSGRARVFETQYNSRSATGVEGPQKP